MEANLSTVTAAHIVLTHYPVLTPRHREGALLLDTFLGFLDTIPSFPGIPAPMFGSMPCNELGMSKGLFQLATLVRLNSIMSDFLSIKRVSCFTQAPILYSIIIQQDHNGISQNLLLLVAGYYMRWVSFSYCALTPVFRHGSIAMSSRQPTPKQQLPS